MAKSIVLVGMGPGNGMSQARKFGKEGYKVFILARNEDNLKAYQEKLEKDKIKVEYKVADASDEEHLRIAFKEIYLAGNNPEVLIYNASVLTQRPPSRLVPDHVVHDFRINVVGAIIAVQEVLPHMLKKKKGSILITGGGLAINPYFEMSSLGIGKAGIRNYAHSLAQELKDTGIHVATITINGMVKKGSKFDPDKIADEFWRIHNQKKEDWETEILYE